MRQTVARQVLKDTMALSEQAGVLDGGSVVHVIGRPPEAEGPVRARPELEPPARGRALQGPAPFRALPRARRRVF